MTETSLERKLKNAIKDLESIAYLARRLPVYVGTEGMPAMAIAIRGLAKDAAIRAGSEVIW